MEEKKESPEMPEAAPADSETLSLDTKEDALQDILDEKVADTLLSSDMEVDTSDDGEESAGEDAVTEEIVHQTIAAERAQDTLDTRVLRDFDDGIITFGRDGIIRYINPSASLILGLTENTVGKPYQELFGRENESLWELLAQATEEKETSHRGDVLYRRKDGSTVLLNASCICLRDGDGSRQTTYALHFDDITEIDTLRRKRRESSAVFIGTMTGVSVWMYIVALWRLTGETLSQEIMTQFIHLIALIMFFYIRHYTHFTYEEMGLKIKGIGKAVKTDCLFTVIFAAALFGVKFLLMRTSPDFFPAGAPFWDWGRMNWSDIAYPVTVVLQEFLSRGVIHENLRRIFVGRHSEGAAIIVSSLIFGALHIHRGFMYMLAATALLSIFGILYRRQNSIWGLCIPHFVLGEIVWYLGFV